MSAEDLKDEYIVDFLYRESRKIPEIRESSILLLYTYFTESYPSVERIRNIALASGYAMDTIATDLYRMSKSVAALHPELKAELEKLIFSNLNPYVSRSTQEWKIEFEHLWQASGDQRGEITKRLSEEARSQDSNEKNRGYLKNGAGSNKNFQTALSAFINEKFILSKNSFAFSEVMPFLRMKADNSDSIDLLAHLIEKSETRTEAMKFIYEAFTLIETNFVYNGTQFDNLKGNRLETLTIYRKLLLALQKNTEKRDKFKTSYEKLIETSMGEAVHDYTTNKAYQATNFIQGLVKVLVLEGTYEGGSLHEEYSAKVHRTRSKNNLGRNSPNGN